ncbi:molybdopterin molybdotransferase MoeA [Phaeovulum vinaykumarii]|uniref:Molybdopterin molybdenumtransferase n=1 Tax=Phaeovulum vinaykumarii TaxID=407234 RepID=A0A1N7M1W1_9RHOB|nr:gephyrin-like molybdotransferase Glp [Phaeovulum vinaykumarii]SIS80096.1 molybdopterin molybdochelatase [Phaeovulum vinaykumarii]SOC09408.1 molybdopterin molybdochelatase [Phaeovulum vinaykumarii]
MIEVEEALARVLALVAPLGAETVALRDALGRVLAAPVTARADQPPFAASAMDGYAVAAPDLRPGARLALGPEIPAGATPSGPLPPGTAARVFTGAAVPPGTAAVIIQEVVCAQAGTITLPDPLPRETHIRPQGQDFAQGDSFQPARPLRPADLGLIAAMNLAEVSVHRRPEVAILSSGDELVWPGEDPGPAQIVASNSLALAGMVTAAGGVPRMLPLARDSVESLSDVLALSAGCDLIVSSGGASVGAHDVLARHAAELGLELDFARVAMRPGKPLMAGRRHGVPMLGLPGNPVSALVTATLFLRPMLARMQGLEARPRPDRGVLGAPLPANGPRRHYLRATLARDAQGQPVLTPFAHQDAGRQRLLAEADALVIQPANGPALPTGAEVDFLPL